METFLGGINSLIGSVNGINGMGLGALALIVALMVIWKK